MSYREEIDDIIPYLRNGGLILYPTDTIWGIGCDACNEVAIQKVFALKNRSLDKKMVILVADSEMLSHYVMQVHPKINAINDFHERPVTIIYDNAKNLPTLNIGPTGTIAIRIVKDEFCQAMIRALGSPIISTSANISGEPFPENFNEISRAIKNGVNYIVRHRQNDLSKNQPSVIVELTEKKELNFLRE
jgi:L-threonylcarbamoyladenylate synthase